MLDQFIVIIIKSILIFILANDYLSESYSLLRLFHEFTLSILGQLSHDKVYNSLHCVYVSFPVLYLKQMNGECKYKLLLEN